MTTQTSHTSVSTEVEVDASAEHAFRVFTEGIGTWWDDDKHILQAPLAEMVFEPRAGGHIIDRGTDGSECQWATVLAYEPPVRVCFSWDINLQWQIEPDPERASEVEITRIAQAKPYTVMVLHTTTAFARPACDAVVWEHGRRNMALVEAGLLPVVLPAADDSGIAGYGVFNADLDTTRRLMDNDPGVRAGIFSIELHPVRGFPGSSLP